MAYEEDSSLTFSEAPFLDYLKGAESRFSIFTNIITREEILSSVQASIHFLNYLRDHTFIKNKDRLITVIKSYEKIFQQINQRDKRVLMPFCPIFPTFRKTNFFKFLRSLVILVLLLLFTFIHV